MKTHKKGCLLMDVVVEKQKNKAFNIGDIVEIYDEFYLVEAIRDENLRDSQFRLANISTGGNTTFSGVHDTLTELMVSVPAEYTVYSRHFYELRLVPKDDEVPDF